ncbi:MAG: thiol:disulfide interchange protein DsbA/DsbL [Pseudomonadales bacterium]
MATSKSRSRSPSSARADKLRNAIFVFAALMVVVVGGYGLLYSAGVTDGEFAEGTHYELLEDAPRRRPGAPMVVTEYFSWGCIHCRNFDPMLDEWQTTLAADAAFERAPVSFSPMFALLAQTYIALEEQGALEQNHGRFFRAIHDNRRQFLSVDQLADFVDGNGISKADFLSAYNSTAVRRRLSEIEAGARQASIRSVPALVVAGKYRINMDIGRKQALAVADHLLQLERDSATAPKG